MLGVHLKDLVSLHEAQPDRLPDGRLHLSKLNSLYLRLQELAALQQQQPPCSASKDLLHLLTVSKGMRVRHLGTEALQGVEQVT